MQLDLFLIRTDDPPFPQFLASAYLSVRKRLLPENDIEAKKEHSDSDQCQYEQEKFHKDSTIFRGHPLILLKKRMVADLDNLRHLMNLEG